MEFPRPGFQFKFKRNAQERWAHYEPAENVFYWLDTGEMVFPHAHINPRGKNITTPVVSPESPGRKARDLKLIKIQVGFGCNFSCSYCSQKNFRPSQYIGSREDAKTFVEKMAHWYDGGLGGTGRGTRIEFWGGETLLYWNSVHHMAEILRDKYPEVDLQLFTNGSTLTEEIIAEADRLKIHIVLSHDGLHHENVRGEDPLKNPVTAPLLQKLCKVLAPQNLFSVHMTVSRDNYRLKDNRAYIAEALAIKPYLLAVTFEILLPYDQTTLKMMVQNPAQEIEFTRNILREFREMKMGGALSLLNVGMDLGAYLESLSGNLAYGSIGQRCSMDSPQSLAVDLRGNVLTCQNTTAKGGHKIGHLDDYQNISLNTSWHWSRRESCQRCPVVQMCRGACMYLQGEMWTGACNNFFSYYLGLLAFLFSETIGMELVEIRGDNIRDTKKDQVLVI